MQIVTNNTTIAPAGSGRREMLSKVPEITLWFWIIKILCTTVGESFADWINMTLGVGLEMTAVLFTIVFAGVLIWQLSLRRYVPVVYWLTVVVVSVTGTLYTDILTDALGVPLAVSTAVFAGVLAVAFGVWWASQRTLSIHSITSTPRELSSIRGGHQSPVESRWRAKKRAASSLANEGTPVCPPMLA